MHAARRLPSLCFLAVLVAVDPSRALATPAPLAALPVWSFQGNAPNLDFGTSVCTAGDVNGDGYSDVIVGVPKYTHPQSREGIVYVFHGSAQGPSLAPSWSAESNLNGSQFGDAVAAAGDVNGDGYGDVIVGAPQLGNGENHEGRAYVYLGSATGLAADPVWTFESNQALALFGGSVAAAGDVNGDGYGDIVVGANAYSNGQSGEGRAYVFLGSPTGPAAAPSWTAEINQPDAHFGQSVCTAGDVNGDGYSDVIIGAHDYTNGETQEGAAYCYYGSPGGLPPGPNWVAESNQLQAYFGTSVCTAGDVNGDGYSDVIVGANQWDTNLAEEGRAYVFHGGPLGLAPGPSWFADGAGVVAFFGGSVAAAGDVNEDGYADVIVGGKRLLNFTGTARVFLGSASGLSGAADWAGLGGAPGQSFGASVFTAGDVNGDGHADVIIGAPSVSDPEGAEGAAYVYLGQARGMGATPQNTLSLDETGWTIDMTTGSAGDVNGDGFGDVFVGQPTAEGANLERVGRVDVFYGSPLGCAPVPDWSAEGAPGTGSFGRSVASAGDVNGDGYSDLIVGQTGYTGRVFVFHGSPTGLATVAAWSAVSSTPSDAFGYSTACAGDVNGDGYSDVVVGAHTRQLVHGGSYLGAAYLWYGSASGLGDPATTDAADWWIEGTDEQQGLGRVVGSAGDVNGDGFSDLLVAIPHETGHVSLDQAGGFSVFYGSAAGPATVADWSAAGEGGGAAFDVPAGGAGDVNGDGYSDVFAVSRVRVPPWEDAIHIWYGSALGLGDAGTLANADAQLTSDQLDDGFGETVGCAGDVNGDGLADLFVGAPSYDISGVDASDGRAFLYCGSPNGLQNTATWYSESMGISQRIGQALGGAGDVNGDGFADIVTTDAGDFATFSTLRVWFGEQGGPTLRPRLQRTDGATPIAPLGLTDGTLDAVFAAHARPAFGRTRSQLEWEVRPFGLAFEGRQTKRMTSWDDTGIGDARVAMLDDELPAARTLHWRVRIHYDPARTPFAAPTRWFTQPLGGWNEAGFRLHAAPAAVEPRSDGPTRDGIALSAAPHPLRAGGRITFDLPRDAGVELSLLDVTGARRLQLARGTFGAGTHALPWNGLDASGRPLAPGVYFVRAVVDGRAMLRHKIVVLK